MANAQTQCRSCGAQIDGAADLLGRNRPRPKCGAEQTTEPAGTSPEPRPLGAGTGPTGEELFPERMKANRALAGRSCPHCGSEIELGDPVFNCQECGATMHQGCRESVGRCGNEWCASVDAQASPAAVPTASDEGADQEMAECEFCGERIQKAALKCRYCKEELGSRRRRTERQRRREEEANAKLSGGEIAFGLILSGIAMIVAIVWLLQAKRKGWKLLLLAVASQVCLGILLNL